MKLKIIDNYLTQSYYKAIQDLLIGSDFPWFYNRNISSNIETIGAKSFNEYGFSHHFYKDGYFRDTPYATFIKPMLLNLQDTVNCDCILRSRGDMVMWSYEDFIHTPHVDFDFPNVATILYINDTDGDTILYNQEYPGEGKSIPKNSGLEIKKRVSPKANRLVIFNGAMLHTGSSPTKHKNRILINSNFTNESNTS